MQASLKVGNIKEQVRIPHFGFKEHKHMIAFSKARYIIIESLMGTYKTVLKILSSLVTKPLGVKQSLEHKHLPKGHTSLTQSLLEEPGLNFLPEGQQVLLSEAFTSSHH